MLKQYYLSPPKKSVMHFEIISFSDQLDAAILDLCLLDFLPSRSLLFGWKRRMNNDELPGCENNGAIWLITFSAMWSLLSSLGRKCSVCNTVNCRACVCVCVYDLGLI